MTENKSSFAKAFIKAQSEMVKAIKDSTNPHFKSKYADLSSVRDACVPFLNNNGIAVLQPIIQLDNKQYIKTVLLHESGEEYSCLTEIIYAQNTAQDRNNFTRPRVRNIRLVKASKYHKRPILSKL